MTYNDLKYFEVKAQREFMAKMTCWVYEFRELFSMVTFGNQTLLQGWCYFKPCIKTSILPWDRCPKASRPSYFDEDMTETTVKKFIAEILARYAYLVYAINYHNDHENDQGYMVHIKARHTKYLNNKIYLCSNYNGDYKKCFNELSNIINKTIRDNHYVGC